MQTLHFQVWYRRGIDAESIAMRTCFHSTIMMLAGTELVFFVEAHTMLCFGLLMKTAVTAHGCSAVAEQLAQRSLPQELEGTQPGQLAQAAQRDVSHCPASCSVMTAGAKEEEGGDTICLPKKSPCVRSPAGLQQLAPACRWEAASGARSGFTWWTVLSSTHEFSHFAFWFSVPIAPEESEQAAGCCLPGLRHKKQAGVKLKS